MGNMTISAHHGARHRHRIAAVFWWIVVGIVAVIAFGDALTLLAVALGAVITAWLIRREMKDRVKRNDARRRRLPSRPVTKALGSASRPSIRSDEPLPFRKRASTRNHRADPSSLRRRAPGTGSRVAC